MICIADLSQLGRGRVLEFRRIEPGTVRTEWGLRPPKIISKRSDAAPARAADDIATVLLYAFAQPPQVLVEEILPLLNIKPIDLAILENPVPPKI